MQNKLSHHLIVEVYGFIMIQIVRMKELVWLWRDLDWKMHAASFQMSVIFKKDTVTNGLFISPVKTSFCILIDFAFVPCLKDVIKMC